MTRTQRDALVDLDRAQGPAGTPRTHGDEGTVRAAVFAVLGLLVTGVLFGLLTTLMNGREVTLARVAIRGLLFVVGMAVIKYGPCLFHQMRRRAR